MTIRKSQSQKWFVGALLLLVTGCGGSAESREGEGVALESEVEAGETVEPMADSGAAEPPTPAGSSGGSSTTTPAPRPATPPPAPEPSREVAIPTGTMIPAVMEASVSTRTHRVDDIFYARVTEEILAADGMVLVPLGARLEGRVAEARQSTSAEEEALLLLTFENLLIQGERFPLNAAVTEAAVTSEARDSGARSAATVATGAAAGAIVGRILGSDTRSTVQGAVVGAVAGAGVALTTRDGHASIDEGARVVVRLDGPAVLSRD